jgi:peptidyl-prolyl cis-trans isomerase A (cyclophilin A)
MKTMSRSVRFPSSARLLVAAILLLLGACAPRATAPTGAAASPLLDPGSPLMNRIAPDSFKVLFETTAGDFMVEVERSRAPLGADRFYNLVRHGYYDGVRFFRVVPGFVVQFGLHGDPQVTNAWRDARISDDSVSASNRRGSITFATSGPDTRTVQVFINLADNVRLDAQGFAPFGVVTGGMDAVDRLHSGYGEGAPRGRGPDQAQIRQEGEAYLAREFPELDRVLRTRILSPQTPAPRP